MTQLETSHQRFRGLSTEPKPGLRVDRDSEHTETVQPSVGSVFTEIDTGRRFVWTVSGEWERQEQTIEEYFARLIDVNEQILATLQATHRGHEEYSWEENVEIEDP